LPKDKIAIATKKFRVKENKKVDLAKWPTLIKPVYSSK
jgi:hypothetical protein